MNWIGINPKAFDTSDLSLLTFFAILVPMTLSVFPRVWKLLLRLHGASLSFFFLNIAAFQSLSIGSHFVVSYEVIPFNSQT